MSRSWERKVQKNQTQLNKQRKKQGKTPVSFSKPASASMDVYKGRSYMLPIFLLLFILLYLLLSMQNDQYKDSGSMFWITIGLYVLLAVVFALRRPYLAIGKDVIRSRRFTGDRVLTVSQIKGISVQKGSVMIELPKGGNWLFSRLMNLYPTDEMAERLRAFATANNIPFTEK